MGLIAIFMLWLAISFQMEGGDSLIVAVGKVFGFLSGIMAIFVGIMWIVT